MNTPDPLIAEAENIFTNAHQSLQNGDQSAAYGWLARLPPGWFFAKYAKSLSAYDAANLGMEFDRLRRGAHAGLPHRALWGEDQHPRWPAGDEQGRGGQFAPAGGGGGALSNSTEIAPTYGAAARGDSPAAGVGATGGTIGVASSADISNTATTWQPISDAADWLLRTLSPVRPAAAAGPPGEETRGGNFEELTPAAQIRGEIYRRAIETLGALDPTNKELESLRPPGWNPSQQDVDRVNGEIWRLRSELGKTRDIERHHAIPKEFADQAKRLGIDLEDYVMFMGTADHRLLPDGLHTGADNWNAQWRAFFSKHKDAKAPLIQQQLLKMLRESEQR